MLERTAEQTEFLPAGPASGRRHSVAHSGGRMWERTWQHKVCCSGGAQNTWQATANALARRSRAEHAARHRPAPKRSAAFGQTELEQRHGRIPLQSPLSPIESVRHSALCMVQLSASPPPQANGYT